MIAPAARPPMMPAPTPQPRQPASAVVGTAMVARAIAPAAAKAVKVLCILSLVLWGGDRPSTESGFAAQSILRATGIEGDSSPGNLSEVCYSRSSRVQG